MLSLLTFISVIPPLLWGLNPLLIQGGYRLPELHRAVLPGAFVVIAATAIVRQEPVQAAAALAAAVAVGLRPGQIGSLALLAGVQSATLDQTGVLCGMILAVAALAAAKLRVPSNAPEPVPSWLDVPDDAPPTTVDVDDLEEEWQTLPTVAPTFPVADPQPVEPADVIAYTRRRRRDVAAPSAMAAPRTSSPMTSDGAFTRRRRLR